MSDTESAVPTALGPATLSTPCKMYRCAPNLRWVKSPPNIFQFASFAPPPNTLQQAWVCDADGSVEWRDVPLVDQ